MSTGPMCARLETAVVAGLLASTRGLEVTASSIPAPADHRLVPIDSGNERVRRLEVQVRP